MIYKNKHSQNPPIQNTYLEIIPDRIERLLESTETGYWHLKVRRVNKTRAIFGYISFLKPMGDDIQLEAKSLKKQGKKIFGEWISLLTLKILTFRWRVSIFALQAIKTPFLSILLKRCHDI